MTTKNDIARELASRSGITQAAARDAVDGMIGLIVQHLKAGDEVKLDGLGTFKVKPTAPRVGRNPRSGEVVQIAAGKKVTFKVAADLKRAI